jgi:hypothetical protein
MFFHLLYLSIESLTTHVQPKNYQSVVFVFKLIVFLLLSNGNVFYCSVILSKFIRYKNPLNVISLIYTQIDYINRMITIARSNRRILTKNDLIIDYKQCKPNYKIISDHVKRRSLYIF